MILVLAGAALVAAGFIAALGVADIRLRRLAEQNAVQFLTGPFGGPATVLIRGGRFLPQALRGRYADIEVSGSGLRPAAGAAGTRPGRACRDGVDRAGGADGRDRREPGRLSAQRRCGCRTGRWQSSTWPGYPVRMGIERHARPPVSALLTSRRTVDLCRVGSCLCRHA